MRVGLLFWWVREVDRIDVVHWNQRQDPKGVVKPPTLLPALLLAITQTLV